MRRRRLEDDQIAEALAGVDGWNADNGWLKKRYDFRNFAESLAFVNKVGEIAEDEDHHPDFKFGWGYVELELTTHDKGGLTQRDFDVAKRIDLIGQ